MPVLGHAGDHDGFDADATVIEPPRFDLAAISLVAPAERAPVSSWIPSPGDRVGQYLVVRLIATGGYGHIHEVSHLPSGKRFAMKSLKPEHRGNDIVVKKLRAGARVMMDCRGHPGLCEVQEIGEHPRLGVFVVMELLEGESLREVLRKAQARGIRIGMRAVLKTLIEVADTLHAMHLLGAVHRDVKPDNIFLVKQAERGARTVVLDWDTSSNKYGPHTTDAESAALTALYAAPEQVRRQRATAAADQYAVAHVLYECLHEHAFAEEASQNPGKQALFMIWQANLAPKPLPREICPPALWTILDRAFQKDPKERFPSMRALADELRHILENLDAYRAGAAGSAASAPKKPTLPASAGLAPLADRPDRQPVRAGEVRSPARRVQLTADHPAPTLVVLSPPELRGRRFELGDGGIIGRFSGEADLILDDSTVSNRHCRYTYVTGGNADPVYCIEDLGSSNGTAIEGNPIGRRTGAVKQGERIRLGDVHVVLLAAGSISADLKEFAPRRPRLPTAPRIATPAEKREQFRGPWELVSGSAEALGRPAPNHVDAVQRRQPSEDVLRRVALGLASVVVVLLVLGVLQRLRILDLRTLLSIP